LFRQLVITPPTPGNGCHRTGLYWLAVGLAERAPLLLAVDDLHWLDEESVRFVGYLLPRLEGIPLLVLATARAPEPGVDEAASAVQASFGTVIRPRLLTASAAGRVLPGRPQDEFHRVTGGNPFLLVELGRALVRSPAGGALHELGSEAVARLVTRRVARISEDAVGLAGALALFGAGASLPDAARVAGVELSAAAVAADALIKSQVLTVAGGDRLEFLHPLIRAAMYEQLGPFARRCGHAVAAEALNDRGAPPEEIAAPGGGGHRACRHRVRQHGSSRAGHHRPGDAARRSRSG